MSFCALDHRGAYLVSLFMVFFLMLVTVAMTMLQQETLVGILPRSIRKTG